MEVKVVPSTPDMCEDNYIYLCDVIIVSKFQIKFCIQEVFLNHQSEGLVEQLELNWN